MVNRTRNCIRMILSCAALLFPLHGACAADGAYPVRPIRMIVPFVAGGGTDLLARLLTPRLSEALGQQIVVDNRGGAGSIVGTQMLSKSPPDGYTIAVLDTAFAINPGLAEKLPYDAERDFNFVAIIATSPTVLVTHPGLKVRTLQELIAAAKANPGKIRAASAGIGSSSHLTIEMLNAAAKIKLLHVPYKGAGAAIQDILGGHADLTFVVAGSVIAQIQAGTMIALAVTGKSSVLLPNVPTFAAAGFPEVNPEAFRFIAAPAGIPAPVNQKLTAALSTIMGSQELRTRLIDNGFDPEFQTGKEARDFVVREIRKWRQAVKDSGAKAN
ncbi:MAG: tricarboxylate binding receptor [Betaproteobacteria bacterium]|jgi:tripartite-type tricarboxylate transporter receptor subunit TctC|nr:tricarboxylate binding receptor [Betaproteobacteria bacterium]